MCSTDSEIENEIPITKLRIDARNCPIDPVYPAERILLLEKVSSSKPNI